jgi:hypothetical protein
MEDFDDFLEIIDFGFPRFQFTRSDRLNCKQFARSSKSNDFHFGK